MVKNIWLFVTWGIIVMIATLYAAIRIPIELAFDPQRAGSVGFNWFISLLFFADFIVHTVRFLRKKARNEFQEFRKWEWHQEALLAMDLLAALPLPLFFPGLPLLNLIRLFKLFRVDYMLRTYWYTLLRYAGTFTFLSFVFWILIAINGLACGWHAVGKHPPQPEIWPQYLDALYWTSTTLTAVGYGDITPVDNAQKIYAMFVQILGFGVFTVIIGTVAGRLVRKDPATRRYEENLDSLEALIHYRSLPGDLTNRIIDFYRYMRRKRLGYDETSFLESLPENLQREVALYLKKDVIEKVSLFKNASPEFKQEIALLLRPMFLMPGDCVFKAGDPGEEMYFVVTGELDALTPSEDEILTTLQVGDFFGEIALFKNQPRSATINTLSFCNIYALDKSSFDKVIVRYPEIGRQIRETVEDREQNFSV